MKKKNLFLGMAAILTLLIMGCSDSKEAPPPPKYMVTAINVAGVNVTPLVEPAETIAGAEAMEVVVNTERPPTESESPDGIYYKPVQPITVTLSNVNHTVFFNVMPPGENPTVIELPGVAENSKVTRNIAITLPNNDNFQVGQVVWIMVVAADESKTNYFKINVVNQTHDTALTSVKVKGYDILDTDQSGHIGPWLLKSTWSEATAALVNLKQSESSGVTVAITPRNNQFENAKPKYEYAKILKANASGEPSAWTATPPTDFSDGDILAVKVTASNARTTGYLKVTVNIGGSPFLSSLKVNNKDIGLGNPNADITLVGGAYRVEEGQTLTGSAVTWAVTPVASDPNATVTWALVGKNATPQTGDFTKPTSFDTSHNYLYIKVTSQNSGFTMYYLVVFDERPKNTEHIKVGAKHVPIYKFTIPPDKTWADMGEYPKLRVKILQEEAEYNQGDGYQRNFAFGELSRTSQWDAANPFTVNYGASGFNVYMPLLLNRKAKDWTMNIPGNVPAPDVWYIIEYPLNNPPDWRPPWDPTATRPDIVNAYNSTDYWPLPATTGDVYFGYGITFDATREYWIKELSLVSEDGSIIIPCDLLGDGRIDSKTDTAGFVRTDASLVSGATFLRELVADPTLK
jgi:hypothetical protein